jgi:hypothetical protein
MAKYLTGTDLDAAVAEHVMGWRIVGAGEVDGYAPGYWTQQPPGEINPTGWAGPPPYSTTILYGWKVVERLREQGYLVRVQEHPDGFPFYLALTEHNLPDERSRIDKQAMCLINLYGPASEGKPFRACEGRGYGASAPEAICRAALDLLDNQS